MSVRRIPCCVTVLGAFVIALGCSKPKGAPPSLPDGAPSLRARAACPAAAPDNAAGAPATLGASEYSCHKDSDCTSKSGKNGRCTLTGGHAMMTVRCTYDDCETDGDCSGGALCICGSRNACRPANCHDDTDCTDGKRCDDSRGAIGEPGGRFCHTNKDKCDSSSGCSGGQECGFETSSRRWACATPPPRPVG